MEEGIVPGDWKTANVTLIFKKGPANYRAISLTSVLCKIMEAVISDAIVNHLETNKLITDTQHGFRNGRSCLTNLLSYLELLTKNIDEGNIIKRSIAVSGNHLTSTGNHMPYGITVTHCYLPPGSGDFPAFTPAEAGTRFSDPGRMQG